MNKGIISGHPRVTVARLPAGPVVTYDRHTEESAAISRFVAVAACAIGLALFVAALVKSWQAGRIIWPHMAITALTLGVPIAGLVYMLIAAWNRVEVTMVGDCLQIRPRPFNVGRGQDVPREQIDHLQIERMNGYAIQFVDAEGLGLLPIRSGLSRIPTQDEARAVAASVAQQFGLRFLPDIQPRAALSPSLGEDTAASKTEGFGLIGPSASSQQEIKGYIRTRQTNAGDVLTYAPSYQSRIATIAFAIFWLGVCLKVTSALLSGQAEGGESFGWLSLLPFWIAGFAVLGSALTQNEFLIESDYLVHQTRLVVMAWHNSRIPLAEIVRVGLDVYWDSYNTMHYRVVAQVELGQDRVLVGDIPEADGHALSMALNRQFGVPV